MECLRKYLGLLPEEGATVRQRYLVVLILYNVRGFHPLQCEICLTTKLFLPFRGHILHSCFGVCWEGQGMVLGMSS